MREHPLACRVRVLVLGLSLCVLSGLAHAVEQGAGPDANAAVPAFDRKAALRESQAVIGDRVGDYTLEDRSGQPVQLSELRGRPLVVSLIYTSCYHVCPMITRHLANVVRTARDALGDDSFAVVTVGFDAGVDTPQAMRSFAAKQGVDADDWYFLSGDRATIEALTDDLGFTYVRSPKGFDHMAQATVVDGEGRVYRQVYGQQFDTPLLVEPLKELVFDRRSSPVTVEQMWNRVLFFCTTYDPSSGSYRFDYSLFIGLAIAAMILIGVTVSLVQELRRRRAAS